MPDGARDPRTPSPNPGDAQVPRRRRRWGIWTLGFLALAMVSMITAQAMGGYTIGALGSLLFGLIGAGYSTVRGIQDLNERGIWRVLSGARTPPRQDGPDDSPH